MLVPACVMNTCLGEERERLLTSAVDGGVCSNSSSGSYVLEIEPISHSVKTWSYPRGDSNAFDQRKISCLC